MLYPQTFQSYKCWTSKIPYRSIGREDLFGSYVIVINYTIALSALSTQATETFCRPTLFNTIIMYIYGIELFISFM